MAEFIIVLSVILIFLLIFIQDFSVRFLYKDKFSTELDYSFFSVILSGAKSGGGFGSLSRNVLERIKKTAEFVLRRSNLEISEIKIPTKESDPKKFSLQYKNLFSLFAIFTVYLSKKTKKLVISDSAITVEGTPEEDSDYVFDVRITAPLYVALYATAMFFLIKLKNKRAIKSK